MSEYQYYQFLAVDRPLTDRQMRELRAISTRAEITPTSFTNVYHWGDLKARPLNFMKQYFDAHVYVANWGTRCLMLAVPRELIDLDAARQYASDKTLSVHVHKDRAILAFYTPEESGYDDEFDSGEGWMPSLLPLRDELMRGDLRSLYAAWLAGVFEDDEETEPPVPPGLGKRTAALESLIGFLRVDPHLVDAAAEGAGESGPAGPSSDDVAAWVAKLPAAEKDGVLCELLSDDVTPAEVAGRLRQRFQKQWNEANRPAQAPAKPPGRTIAELFARREVLAAEARRREARRLAKKRAAEKRKAAAARRRFLEEMAPNEDKLWRDVDSLLKMTHAKNYDRAVERLTDLRDLAARASTEAAWQERIIKLSRRHRRKPALMKRFDEAGFPS